MNLRPRTQAMRGSLCVAGATSVRFADAHAAKYGYQEAPMAKSRIGWVTVVDGGHFVDNIGTHDTLEQAKAQGEDWLITNQILADDYECG